MGKVLIITPEVYFDSISFGFEQNNWACTSIFYGISKNRWINKFNSIRFGSVWKQITSSFNKELIKQLTHKIQVEKPDFILFVKGNKLNKTTEKLIAEIKVPIILWTLDSVSRFPTQMSLGNFAKHIFVQDGVDVLNEKFTWLPLGFDPRPYVPIDFNNKSLDVLMIGNIDLPNYKSRNDFVHKYLESELVKKYRCGFSGPIAKYPDLSMKMGAIPNFVFTNRLSAKKYAEVISSAKICINIHQDDGDMPVNPSFFAISGAKVCQVAQDRAYLHQWLRPGVDYIETKTDSFLETVQSLLENIELMKTISENGYIESQNRHTFEARVKQIIDKAFE